MKLPIRLSKDSREPIYHQIEKQLKALIAGGHLEAHTTLPSIRILSKDLEVSVITTRRAYQNLEQQGFIQTLQGKGTFVADVSTEERQDVKTAEVEESIRESIEAARRYDYSFEEIEEIFQKVLKKIVKEESS